MKNKRAKAENALTNMNLIFDKSAHKIRIFYYIDSIINLYQLTHHTLEQSLILTNTGILIWGLKTQFYSFTLLSKSWNWEKCYFCLTSKSFYHIWALLTVILPYMGITVNQFTWGLLQSSREGHVQKHSKSFLLDPVFLHLRACKKHYLCTFCMYVEAQKIRREFKNLF